MDPLKLPDEFQGKWNHCIILTYGIDIPFFENALWAQFDVSCRNKLILADWREYLAESAACADNGMVRFINRLYVADGLMTIHAAHAKVILLTNGEEGRLLVGSGNLNLNGYASGGEVFTKYEYSAKSKEHLSAFSSIRELLEGVLGRQYVGATAAKRIRYLLEQTPWLYQATPGKWNPVRHNLQQSFLEQLQQVVGNERVEELQIAVPFYDKEAVALQRLVKMFDPKHFTLLVQPDQTSIEPECLMGLPRFGGHRDKIPVSI